MSSKVYSPVTKTYEYLLQIGLDQDKTSSYAEQVYYADTDKTFTLSTTQGIARIKSDFNLKKFPFDEQEFIIELFPPYGIEYNDDNNFPKPFVNFCTKKKCLS